MMGGILSMEQVKHFQNIMDWEEYEEDENIPDEIKLTLLDTGYRKNDVIEGGDTGEVTNCDVYKLREVLFVPLWKIFGLFAKKTSEKFFTSLFMKKFRKISTRVAFNCVNGSVLKVRTTSHRLKILIYSLL